MLTITDLVADASVLWVGVGILCINVLGFTVARRLLERAEGRGSSDFSRADYDRHAANEERKLRDWS